MVLEAIKEPTEPIDQDEDLNGLTVSSGPIRMEELASLKRYITCSCNYYGSHKIRIKSHYLGMTLEKKFIFTGKEIYLHWKKN